MIDAGEHLSDMPDELMEFCYAVHAYQSATRSLGICLEKYRDLTIDDDMDPDDAINASRDADDAIDAAIEIQCDQYHKVCVARDNVIRRMTGREQEAKDCDIRVRIFSPPVTGKPLRLRLLKERCEELASEILELDGVSRIVWEIGRESFELEAPIPGSEEEEGLEE